VGINQLLVFCSGCGCCFVALAAGFSLRCWCFGVGDLLLGAVRCVPAGFKYCSFFGLSFCFWGVGVVFDILVIVYCCFLVGWLHWTVLCGLCDRKCGLVICCRNAFFKQPASLFLGFGVAW